MTIQNFRRAFLLSTLAFATGAAAQTNSPDDLSKLKGQVDTFLAQVDKQNGPTFNGKDQHLSQEKILETIASLRKITQQQKDLRKQELNPRAPQPSPRTCTDFRSFMRSIQSNIEVFSNTVSSTAKQYTDKKLQMLAGLDLRLQRAQECAQMISDANKYRGTPEAPEHAYDGQ
ncbi:MAG: hypothetical protein JST16_18980 [Bdellovibrionales bacterium]|nr:hypothetical protein [Bdellovibrionales bacterium]